MQEFYVEEAMSLPKIRAYAIDKFKELREMLGAEDIDGMRKMMRHSTERRALFDKKFIT